MPAPQAVSQVISLEGSAMRFERVEADNMSECAALAKEWVEVTKP
jgi:hypothetical protein